VTKKSNGAAETPDEVDNTVEDVVAEEMEAAVESAAGSAEGGEPDPVAELTGQLEAARAEAHENHDKMLRMAAELENFKKRVGREKETALKYAEENILKELLPSVDNMERAIEQGRADDDTGALFEGVVMTLKGLLASLEKFGLKQLASVGQPFDPNFHEAIGMEASDEVAANTVLKEFQKGYLYKERLLRAAKVIVATGNGQ